MERIAGTGSSEDSNRFFLFSLFIFSLPTRADAGGGHRKPSHCCDKGNP